MRIIDPEGDLAAGATGLAHILLHEALVVAAGDRFILRGLSPLETIGGGMVLSARAKRLRRHAAVRERWQAARTAALAGDVLAAELLAGPNPIVGSAEAHRLTQRPRDEAAGEVAAAVRSGLLIDLGSTGAGGEYLVRSRISEVAEGLEKALERFHRANPFAGGMVPAQACEAAGVTVKSFERLAGVLAEEGVIVCRNGRLALARFRPSLSERLAALRQRVLAAVREAGVNAPARGNLMRDLGIAEADMKIIEKSLVEERTIHVLDGNLMDGKVYEEARAQLLTLFGQMDTLELATFRDALGTNRKMALAMLAAFDAEGLTRRVGNARVLARKKS